MANGISTYITRDKKRYRIDGFSNHLYKNDFYELIKRTYNLILKNDPSEVYVDILVEDEFKMEIFSELGFVLSNNYYCKLKAVKARPTQLVLKNNFCYI